MGPGRLPAPTCKAPKGTSPAPPALTPPSSSSPPTTHTQANLSYALPSTLPHFALVNHQLRSMRNALVLASELGGAATVLPSIWVGLDRWWAPHDGRLPNSRIDLPLPRPADLVLDLRCEEGAGCKGGMRGGGGRRGGGPAGRLSVPAGAAMVAQGPAAGAGLVSHCRGVHTLLRMVRPGPPSYRAQTPSPGTQAGGGACSLAEAHVPPTLVAGTG